MDVLDNNGLDTQIAFIKAYVDKQIKAHASIPVGYEYFSMNPNVPQGSLPLLGGLYDRATYPDLWDWVQEQSGYCKTEQEWQTLSAAQNGNVPFYSSGDGSTTFRVPSLKCWVKGANGTITEVGSYLEAGLPNIVGAISPSVLTGAARVTNVGTGAFNSGGQTTVTRSGGNTGDIGYFSMNFDASRSSSVYGNSTTVQPESIVGLWLVKAYGNIEDTGSINEQQYIDDRIAALPNSFLPLSGGTMTGDITFSGIVTSFKRTNDTGYMQFFGGKTWENGAHLILNGTNRPNEGGEFALIARSSSSYLNLHGKPDGSLTWGNANVLTSNMVNINVDVISNNRHIRVYNPSFTKGDIPSSAINVLHVDYYDKNNYFNDLSRICGTGAYIDTAGDVHFQCYAFKNVANSTYRADLIIDCFRNGSASSVRPGSDNAINLGISINRWKQLYAGTTTIATSDERLKDNIKDIPDEVLDAWGEVNWYQYQFKDSIEEKGESNARLHTGAIAQRIEFIFKSHNLDVNRYGLLCYDAWDAEDEQCDEEGNILSPAREAGDRYSLRYEEALCMEAAYQRRRADRLEERIARLEALLESK